MNCSFFSQHSQGFGAKRSGFTLLELLVALTIVAIVSSIAIPIYTTFSERAYRAEVQADLLTCAQGLERWSAVWFTYLGAADEDEDGPSDGVASASDSGPPGDEICEPISVEQNRYEIEMAANATTFTLTASPIAGGVMDGDGDFTIDEAGNRQWDGVDGWDED